MKKKDDKINKILHLFEKKDDKKIKNSPFWKKFFFWFFNTFYYLINILRHIIGESDVKIKKSWQMAKIAYFNLFWKPYVQSLPNLAQL